MWIILFNAIDEFGIKDNGSPVQQADADEIAEAKKKLADEALHGALRISGLVSISTNRRALLF
jgi:hypothetical protein